MEHAYGRARELCAQRGDTPQLFPVLRGLLLYYLNRGDVQTASQLGEQLLRLAQAQPDPALRMLAHYQLGNVDSGGASRPRPGPIPAQALALYDPQAHRALAVRYGIDLGVASHSHLAGRCGSWALPIRPRSTARRHAPWRRRWRTPLAWCRRWSMRPSCISGAARSWRWIEQAAATITLATEQGFVQWVARGTVLHGWALALQGQGEAGIAAIRQGLAADLATGATLWQPYFLGLLAEAYGAGGHPDAGLHALAEARPLVAGAVEEFRRRQIYVRPAFILLFAGRTSLAAGRIDEAAGHAREALALTRRALGAGPARPTPLPRR